MIGVSSLITSNFPACFSRATLFALSWSCVALSVSFTMCSSQSRGTVLHHHVHHHVVAVKIPYYFNNFPSQSFLFSTTHSHTNDLLYIQFLDRSAKAGPFLLLVHILDPACLVQPSTLPQDLRRCHSHTQTLYLHRPRSLRIRKGWSFFSPQQILDPTCLVQTLYLSTVTTTPSRAAFQSSPTDSTIPKHRHAYSCGHLEVRSLPMLSNTLPPTKQSPLFTTNVTVHSLQFQC